MSTRNNQDRLGALDADGSDPTQTSGENNFSFVTPTEFVELPSRGRYYPEDHPLHNQEMVEINYMTAKDEDILASQSLIKKGLVLDRFLQNIVVDKSISMQDLLVGDKGAIMVAARITGYGSDYTVDVTCPSCGIQSENIYDLNEILEITHADDYDKSNTEVTNEGTFLIELPVSKATVEIKLMSGVDETKLRSLKERKKKLKLPETDLTDSLRTIILSVNGSDQRNSINEFIQSMPSADGKHIRSVYQKVNPAANLKAFFECDACEYAKEVYVPITVRFFWPE